MTGRRPGEDLSRHPGWWARLEGEALDLEWLADALPESDSACVLRLDGRYYLRAPSAQDADDPGVVEERSAEILRVMNGAARVEHANARAVHITTVVRVAADGSLSPHYANLRANIRVRSRVRASLTTAAEQDTAAARTLTERAVALGMQNADVERALRIFGRDDADYRDLYHVFEIAARSLGSNLYATGLVTKKEVKRFKHTANSVHALGDHARHGHQNDQPPSPPTSYDDAHELVARVLRVWLDRLDSSDDESVLDS